MNNTGIAGEAAGQDASAVPSSGGKRRALRPVYLVLVALLGALTLVLMMGGALAAWIFGGSTWSREVLVDSDVEASVAVVRMAGVIGAPSRSGGIDPEEVRQTLDALAEQDWVAGLIVSIDSPGGGAMASDRIARELRRFRKNTGTPVVALMGGVAASGGYYIAAPCDWIVADEMTLTGSIGVILSSLNIRGLLDRFGVTPMVFKSGRHKDMLNPWKAPEEIEASERAMVQELVDDTYARFQDVVAEGRAASFENHGDQGARPLVKNWHDYADGRVFSGQRAYEWGFVDELGDRERAFERVKALAGLSEAKLVAIQRRTGLRDWFRLNAQRWVGGPSWIDEGLAEALGPVVKPGRLYFLQGY